MDGGFKLIERLDEQCASTEVALGRAPAVVQPAPAAARSPYPPAAALPTLQGPAGIRFDFNLGARVLLPNRTQGRWRVRLHDLDTGNLLFESENQGAFVDFAKR